MKKKLGNSHRIKRLFFHREAWRLNKIWLVYWVAPSEAFPDACPSGWAWVLASRPLPAPGPWPLSHRHRAPSISDGLSSSLPSPHYTLSRAHWTGLGCRAPEWTYALLSRPSRLPPLLLEVVQATPGRVYSLRLCPPVREAVPPGGRRQFLSLQSVWWLSGPRLAEMTQRTWELAFLKRWLLFPSLHC